MVFVRKRILGILSSFSIAFLETRMPKFYKSAFSLGIMPVFPMFDSMPSRVRLNTDII
jgi:hypothetical protein